MKPKNKALLIVALAGVAFVTTLFAAPTPFVGFRGATYFIGYHPTDHVSFFGKPNGTGQQAATVTNRAALVNLGLIAADNTATTATATAGAATLSKLAGTITSEALTTAAGAAYTLTLTNTLVTTSSIIVASVDTGTNTTAGLEVGRITPGSGSATILVWNRHASAAVNGTIKVRFAILQ